MSGPARRSLADRFWAKVDVRGPNDCWPWRGTVQVHGYGQIGAGGNRGKTLKSHRVAYELTHGPIPPGMTIDHMCHNGSACLERLAACRHRRCCNPAHLEIATQGDNVRRAKGRLTHCAKGHPWDEANTRWTTTGTRICRQCNLDWQRDQRRAAGILPYGAATHCKRGHPFDSPNARNGHGECQACIDARMTIARGVCLHCGGPKGPGKGRKLCDACRSTS